MVAAAVTASGCVTVAVTVVLALSQVALYDDTYQVVVLPMAVVYVALEPDCRTVVDVAVAYHL